MKKIKTKNRFRKNKVRYSLILLITLALGSGLAYLLKSNTKPVTKPASKVETISSNSVEKKDTTLELAAVGDMLPHDTLTQAAKTSDGYDYTKLISPELQTSFKQADLRFCNQESPSAANMAVNGYPNFNAPAAFPRDLSKFGCNIVSTGNNHSNDNGKKGIDGTLEEWDKLKPLAISGTNRNQSEQNKLQIFGVKGIKIGYVAFNEMNNNASSDSASINMLNNTALLKSQIEGLRSNSDVVIVSVHWGSEDSHNPTSAQKNYAQKIADLGADIIIGTGPHVWQPYQLLNRKDGGNTHAWYSIGNGINTQTKADQLFSGVAILKITKDKSGKVSASSPRVLPTYMHYVWTKGVGLSESALLGRNQLKWAIAAEAASESLISQRNDFKTTAEEQLTKLKSYINNDSVELLKSY